MEIDFNSYGLDEEQAAKLKSEITGFLDSEVSGLKNKNSELIERIGKQKAAFESAELEKAKEIEQAKVEAAEKTGDIEKYKQALADKEATLAEVKSKYEVERNETALSKVKDGFMMKIVEDPAARLYMESLLKNHVDVSEGVVKPKDPSIDLNGLVDRLISDESNAKYIKANVGSGSGSAGPQSGGAASAGKADFSGSQQERVNAAIRANPKLASLPLK